jgi:hypothetical protein
VNCIHLTDGTCQWQLLRVWWRTFQFYLVMQFSRKTLFRECIDILLFNKYNASSSTTDIRSSSLGVTNHCGFVFTTL